MKLQPLLLMYVIKCCIGVRLSPLENNDKLQDITNLYVAEWQWESWPVKQELSEQEGRSPGLRKNVALWKDHSKSAWYLFGGQPINGDPKKFYSDVWKFTVKTRVWKRFFPSQGESKGAHSNKKGGMTALRAVLLDESNASYFEPINRNMVLCGGLGKKNSTKSKSYSEWSIFRRKKLDDEKSEELKSLAIYSPGTPKSNTVWQIDVKERVWTAYVCCCDTSKNENSTSNSAKNPSSKIKVPTAPLENHFKVEKNTSSTNGSKPFFDTKINNAEDEVDNEQQHLTISNLKIKKKKINQIKKSNDKSESKKERGNRKERNVNDTSFQTLPEGSKVVKNKTLQNATKVDSKKEEIVLNQKNTSGEGKPSSKTVTTNTGGKAKVASEYCPEFSDTGMSVTWCDGRNEALITADVNSSQITLWVFNLKTSHWSQLQVKVCDGVDWPGCSNMSSMRYAGNEEEAYIICSQLEKASNTSNASNKSVTDSRTPPEIPSENNFSVKLVFRINYKEQSLQSLGKIKLNPYFDTQEGESVWQNNTRSVLQVIKNSENETILILAYLDVVDLWILNKNHEGKESFDLIEKIWRGSALKWFDKYNAALYSLQFVSESGSSETILLSNPRNIPTNEYWPRERGRFIIRVFRNENLKNQSFENRTREQNLTYELLQSDYKPAEADHHFNHMYSLKVLVFFGISLAIFAVFGFAAFLKRCVNCPPKIRVRSECHKSPLVIRYSVIPDDLLYPVA